eukprot:TRINITY_DN1684_c0_g1_i1.p1 TRINITY_DN1684_c0_g1~~TRINITY_DN1684_c0_g1_i1.p1  ORF type:complete len:107 (-),score=9.55 TRINITY_DN1684_c0_g1_i1:231-551(-)
MLDSEEAFTYPEVYDLESNERKVPNDLSLKPTAVQISEIHAMMRRNIDQLLKRQEEEMIGRTVAVHRIFHVSASKHLWLDDEYVQFAIAACVLIGVTWMSFKFVFS